MLFNIPRLTRDFFHRDTVIVAQELLGKTLVFRDYQGRITETEAYVGFDDPACHAARGKTKRNAMMFEQPGMAYVYFIYGIYYCLNIVTEDEGFGAAVLIRGVLEEPTVIGEKPRHLNGPGKLCRAWEVNLADNGRDLITDSACGVYDTPPFPEFTATPRIGISKGLDKDWRFLATLLRR